MTVERYLRLIAGTFVLASLVLGYLVSPYFFLFTGFVIKGQMIDDEKSDQQSGKCDQPCRRKR